MAKFDIDQFVEDYTPPDKRTPKMLSWLKALLSAIRWLAKLIQDDYFEGATYSEWDSATTYAKYERVCKGYAVYESLVDNNLNHVVTDTAYWMKVQDEKVGLDERAAYTCEKTMLEYALNKRYGGNFVQPPGVSDIYITRHNVGFGSFVVYNDVTKSSSVYSTYATGAVYNDLLTVSAYNFTINIPATLFTSEADIRQFVDRYNYGGTYYNIETY